MLVAISFYILLKILTWSLWGHLEALSALILRNTLFDGCILILLIYLFKKERLSFSALNMASPHWARYILMGMGLYLLSCPLIILGSWLNKHLMIFFLGPNRLPTFHGLPEIQSALSSVTIALYSISVNPLVEELFFRGFLYRRLRSRWGAWPAILLSSILFSVLHLNLGWLVSFFVLGLLLAYLYQKTNSLLAPITAHVLNNAISLYLHFLL